MTMDLFSKPHSESNSHIARREAGEELDALFVRAMDLSESRHICDLFRWMAEHRHYSLFNLFLAHLQRPGCGLINTEKRWLSLGRKVRSSATPIVILRPMGPVMLVYELGDTIGPDLPQAYFNVRGDISDRDLERLTKRTEGDGIKIKSEKLGTRLGGDVRRTSLEGMTEPFLIRLNDTRTIKEKFRTLCHELAHIYCGHLGRTRSDDWWLDRSKLGKSEKEFEAEGTAHLVLSRAGIKTSSAEYLSGYADRCDLTKVSFDTIVRAAGRIETHWRSGNKPRI